MCASFSHSVLCQEVQAGPAKKVYMSQCSGHQSGPAEPCFCSQRQCCQPGWAHTALSKLFRSVSLLHMFPKYVTCLYSLSQPGYIKGGWGRERRVFGVRGGSEGDKGRSHTIKLCSLGLQRPASCFHAALNYTNPCLSLPLNHIHKIHKASLFTSSSKEISRGAQLRI